MLFRQLTDSTTHQFTYLVASRLGGEAVIIDPTASNGDLCVRLLQALDLRLICALGTNGGLTVSLGLSHLHQKTGCVVAMGQESRVSCVNRRLSDGEVLDLEGLKLEALSTPGHTEDSYSFVMDDRVFTGETLLINDSGRTDLPGGNARLQYDSLFTKLLALAGRTLVYPGRGKVSSDGVHNVTTIAEQRSANPRLQVQSVDEFVANMNLRSATERVVPSHSDIAPVPQSDDQTGGKKDSSLLQIA